MTSNSGAVFFLGSRAHYQVLQQPESQSYDIENGNASTETIYQNPSAHEMSTDNADYGERNWNYDQDINMTEEKEKTDMGNGVKRRTKRRQSETTLCERDNDMKPALLNNIDSSTPKAKTRRRIPVFSFLSSLGRRRRLEQVQYLQHIESALAACTYRGSCRCLDCQSRYFECDESEGYSSDESDYSAQFAPQPAISVQQYEEEEDDDDEVFIDTVPGDNTSTDMLLETKETTTHMSASSCETEEDGDMQLEVAAGTPVILNYLLTHPVTCAIQ
ncbi:hypothetical protein ABMA27_011101 [Loxostege sticticalis]|uniref:DUF4802 domain-containing protein n=1 Tax=Loxostege sticticalis TaxID=481309 RepID=A0ABR3H3B2_LOXSC